ncbi:MATE family efflux transporter DinF [Motilimonas cestriensis]|uniref:MATE family efflux transporter DinF n=1 Tax=Motilimonas cestriensis TaxID=2742685 RepID=UPI003DA1D0F1
MMKSPVWLSDPSYRKRLFALALPMMLSNVTVPLLGLVDAAVLGHLDHSYYLAGVSVGAMLITLAFWLLGFLRMSTTGLVAQAFGRNDAMAIKQVLLQSLVLAGALSVLLLVLQSVILNLGLILAAPSEQVALYAQQYFSIRIWSAPAALANYVILGWLLGMQNARAPMWLLIITNLVNILLDLWFVLGLGWQVQGAAAASVIADYFGFGLGLYFVFHAIKPHWQPGDLSALMKKIWVKVNFFRLIALNRDIFLRTLCVQICFSFMTFYGARLGDDILAANAVLLNFLLFISFALDGLAYAIEAQVGKAVGRRDSVEFKRCVNVTFFYALLFAMLLMVIFALFGAHIIALITDIPSIQTTANNYLIWLVFIPLTSVWCFILDGIFIGATQAKAMRNSMVFATLCCFFPVWWLAKDFGNHSLWMAMNAFMLGRGLSLGYLYCRMQRNNRFWSFNDIG